MSDKHLINHLQKQPVRQGKATPAHVSTQPDPSNITGHKVLICHSSEYLLAVNRIYTGLSMLQGGLPSLFLDCRDLLTLAEGTLAARPPLPPVVTCSTDSEDMELDSMDKKEVCDSSSLDEDQEQQK